MVQLHFRTFPNLHLHELALTLLPPLPLKAPLYTREEPKALVRKSFLAPILVLVVSSTIPDSEAVVHNQGSEVEHSGTNIQGPGSEATTLHERLEPRGSLVPRE